MMVTEGMGRLMVSVPTLRLRQETHFTAAGKMDTDCMVNKYESLMEISKTDTLAIERKINQMDTEVIILLTDINTEETGKKAKDMVEEFGHLKME